MEAVQSLLILLVLSCLLPLLSIMSDNNQKTVSPHVTSLNKWLALKEEGFKPLLVSFKGLNKRIYVYFIVNITETSLPHGNCL